MVVIKAKSNRAITNRCCGPEGPCEVITCPFVVVRDDRERRAGWDFAGMTERQNKRDYQLVVPIREERLLTGDYTIAGMEEMVAVERKSLSDLFGSVVSNRLDPTRRERFKDEHERMAEMVDSGGYAAVIIEASFNEIWESPPLDSGTNPSSVLGTWAAWSTRYRVPWLFGGSRRGAEIMAYRWLLSKWETLKDRDQMRLF